jgi:flagellar L-ring protein precursor FlgH
MRSLAACFLVAAAHGALAAPLPAQNLWKARRSTSSLAEDHSARAVGDILTVVIEERHRVKNQDKVEQSNQSSLAARLEAFTLSNDTFKSTLPELDVRQSRSFAGDAKQEKDSSLEARVSVVVIDVLPNGNLVVAGSRIVNVDDETKTLRISGVVRQLDVTSANSVKSSQVADARVSITGEGSNTRATTRGPVAALFDTLIWLAWPF